MEFISWSYQYKLNMLGVLLRAELEAAAVLLSRGFFTTGAAAGDLVFGLTFFVSIGAH